LEFDFENKNSSLLYLGKDDTYTVGNNETVNGVYYIIFEITKLNEATYYPSTANYVCDDESCEISGGNNKIDKLCSLS
jgi:hypothetical protein